MSKVRNEGPVFYFDGGTTVCLLMQNGSVIARGISVYSRMDTFCFKTGRQIALARAREAAGRQCNCSKILLDAPRSMSFDWLNLSLAKDRFGDFKGYYCPEMTDTEKLLIEARGNGIKKSLNKKCS